MSTALSYIYYILQSTADFVFTDMTIVSGVSVGFVFVCCILMGVLIRNVVNIPSKSQSFRVRKRGDDDE